MATQNPKNQLALDLGDTTAKLTVRDLVVRGEIETPKPRTRRPKPAPTFERALVHGEQRLPLPLAVPLLTLSYAAKTPLRDPMRDVRKGTPCRTRPSGKSPSRTRRWRRVEALHLVYHLVLRLIPGWRGRSQVSERIIGND